MPDRENLMNHAGSDDRKVPARLDPALFAFWRSEGGGAPKRPWKFGWKAAIAVLALMAAAAAFGDWVFSFAIFNTGVLLPGDLTLTRPGPDVPPAIAAFAGIWAGDRWDGTVPHALVVERVGADGAADVIYALGSDWASHEVHSYQRLHGEIVNGHLGFVLPNTHQRVDYSFAAGGRLLGRATTPYGWRSYVLLKRIAAPDLATALAAARRRSDPLWQEIRIPEEARVGAAAGQRIELRATLYRSPLPGRRPLIILNHSSPNDDDAKAGETLRFEDQARYLLALGYSVVVPMRKGRGGSGGPMEEAADLSDRPAPRLQLASGLEDIDAAVDAMAARPDVDPARIVVAGYGRGGLLSVAYAARHPGKVAGAINFSGGWWPAGDKRAALDAETFAAAGRSAAVPMLWLYADDDPDYPLSDVARNFDAFRANGGRGLLFVIRDVRVRNIRVFFWTAKWEGVVRDYLRDVVGPG
ncbi:MAG TPA: dienelactone hydrolase family protein [Alphaproteobacteria bacterium]|nr:dienelactone hydrolase family protein [Alphaproteobacteria bacterium]